MSSFQCITPELRLLRTPNIKSRYITVQLMLDTIIHARSPTELTHPYLIFSRHRGAALSLHNKRSLLISDI